MGIIQRQALRNAIVNFVGAFIGGISRLILPIITPTKSHLGLLNLLDSISALFMIVFNLGYNTILQRMFPNYRDEKGGHHGFLLFGFFLSLIGIVVSFLIFYFFGDYLLNSDTDLDLFHQFSFLIFPLIFFRIIFMNIDGYSRMLYQTFIGTFLDTFLNKIVVVAAIVMYALLIIDFKGFVYLYAASFCIPGILVTIFAFYKTERIILPTRQLISGEDKKRIYEYALFGILMGASGSIVLYIDQFMLTKLISMEMMGIYTQLFFAARLIIIPGNSIARIAHVVLAESWREKDMANIQSIYEKSCVNQLLLAAFLLGLGWALLDPVMTLHPKFIDFIPYKNVFLIIGSGILIEMATGVNAGIIAVTPHYRYNMYFSIGLALLAISSNYVFITYYGLIGAAIASLLSMTVINFMRWLFLYRKYQLQPFGSLFLKALIFCVLFVVGSYFLSYQAHPFVKIAINAVCLTVVFWGVVVAFGFSREINSWVHKIKNKYF